MLSSPQAHCLRICAYILRRVINGPRSGAIREFHLMAFFVLGDKLRLEADDASSPAEKVKLTIAAFEAFSAVAVTFGSSQREDFRALAVTLYCGMLRQ